MYRVKKQPTESSGAICRANVYGKYARARNDIFVRQKIVRERSTARKPWRLRAVSGHGTASGDLEKQGEKDSNGGVSREQPYRSINLYARAAQFIGRETNFVWTLRGMNAVQRERKLAPTESMMETRSNEERGNGEGEVELNT